MISKVPCWANIHNFSTLRPFRWVWKRDSLQFHTKHHFLAYCFFLSQNKVVEA